MFKKMKKYQVQCNISLALIRGSLLGNLGKSHEDYHGKNSKACLPVYEAAWD